jgi:Ca-activated chloride channel homolog
MMFHFLRPWFLLSIIPLTIFCWYLLKKKPKLKAWQAICDKNLLNQLTKEVGKGRKSFSIALFFLIGLLMSVAISGPTWTRLPQQAFKQKIARVVVLDLSEDMLAEDIKPSRLIRAKFKIRDLLSQSKIGQIGMVVFSKEGFVVSPLTDDSKTIMAMIPELTPSIMPVTGSNIAAGLKQAEQLIKQAGFNQGQVILISASAVTQKDINQAKALADSSISVWVMGVGSEIGAPVPESSTFVARQGQMRISKLEKVKLNELAQAGAGRYVDFTSDDKDIKQIVSVNPGQQFMKQDEISSWKDQGRLLLYLIIPLFLIFFRKGFIESLY